MGVALLIIAALLGLLILLLAVPVDVALRLAGMEQFAGHVRVRWLFGLVRFGFWLPRPARRKRRKAKAQPETAKRPARRKARGRPANVVAVLRQAAFRRRLYRLVRDLVHAVHPQDLRFHMRLGLGDPADTGRLWALMGSLTALAQSFPRADTRIEPEFVEPVLEFEAHGRFVLIPLQLIALAIAFVLSPATLSAWRTLRAGRG